MSEELIEVEADSLEEARQQVISQIPEGLHVLSEKVISDGLPKTIKAIAETTEEAVVKAQGDIPNNAEVIEKKEVTAPKQKVITVGAFDEQSARVLMRGKTAQIEMIKSLRLIMPGTRGFLGLGKKPNQYEVDILQHAVVQITYKTKARISAKLGEKPKADDQNLSGSSGNYGSAIHPAQGDGGYDANMNGPFGGSLQPGRDYPSSWHGPNEPGGSLDI